MEANMTSLFTHAHEVGLDETCSEVTDFASGWSTLPHHIFIGLSQIYPIVIMFASTAAFRILATKPMTSTLVSRKMATITTGVEFDTIAREWRLKWSADGDKKSLADVQQVLNKYTASLKKLDGVKSVQRVVCGGCLDYKVVVALPAEKWGAWVSRSHLSCFHALCNTIFIQYLTCV